jgi:hypothetical protein
MENYEPLLQVIFPHFAGNVRKDLGPDREVGDAGVPETGRAPANQIHRRSKSSFAENKDTNTKIRHCQCTVQLPEPEFIND